LIKNSVGLTTAKNVLHRKNGFAKRSKLLAGYRKIILLNYQELYKTLKLIARISKFFTALLIIFKILNKIILIVQQNYFQNCIQQNF